MKKFWIALVALAGFALAPAAQADSFDFTISGSNFSANLTFQATANSANGVVTAGVDTITSVSGTFKDSKGTFTFSNVATEAANAGANGTNLTTSKDGGFLFDNLLYTTASGNKILDWGGLLFTYDGYELNIFSGAGGSGAPGDGFFYFADNGNNHSNNRIPEPVNQDDPANGNLSATPEPGSLLLLGTGLLALAMMGLRRAGKRNPDVPIAS